MEVKNKHNDRSGYFFIENGDQEVAVMHYTIAGPGKIIIDHTEVDEAYEGKGLGRQLVKAGVEYARENHIKILPRCPFAHKIFDLTPDFADVLF